MITVNYEWYGNSACLCFQQHVFTSMLIFFKHLGSIIHINMNSIEIYRYLKPYKLTFFHPTNRRRPPLIPSWTRCRNAADVFWPASAPIGRRLWGRLVLMLLEKYQRCGVLDQGSLDFTILGMNQCKSIWMFPKMVVPNNHGFSY